MYFFTYYRKTYAKMARRLSVYNILAHALLIAQ